LAGSEIVNIAYNFGVVNSFEVSEKRHGVELSILDEQFLYFILGDGLLALFDSHGINLINIFLLVFG
jgi:hypothetical protein